MSWVWFVAGAILSWGLYGPALHRGQALVGHPLRALLCVGFAYFLIGVLVPLAGLGAQGQLHGFTTRGVVTATFAGTLERSARYASSGPSARGARRST
jgi:hypothetical protein